MLMVPASVSVLFTLQPGSSNGTRAPLAAMGRIPMSGSAISLTPQGLVHWTLRILIAMPNWLCEIILGFTS